MYVSSRESSGGGVARSPVTNVPSSGPISADVVSGLRCRFQTRACRSRSCRGSVSRSQPASAGSCVPDTSRRPGTRSRNAKPPGGTHAHLSRSWPTRSMKRASAGGASDGTPLDAIAGRRTSRRISVRLTSIRWATMCPASSRRARDSASAAARRSRSNRSASIGRTTASIRASATRTTSAALRSRPGGDGRHLRARGVIGTGIRAARRGVGDGWALTARRSGVAPKSRARLALRATARRPRSGRRREAKREPNGKQTCEGRRARRIREGTPPLRPRSRRSCSSPDGRT